MALLNFTPVALNAGPVKRDYTQGFKDQFQDIWQFCQENPDTAVTVDFGTHASREDWFNTAKSYGITLDEPTNIRRIKNTDSMNKDHGQMTFIIELMSEKKNRANKDAKSDASLIREWYATQGVTLPPRGRISKEYSEKYYAANPQN